MQPWPLLCGRVSVERVRGGLDGVLHARSSLRENKAITVGEVGVLGVEGHELVEENVRHGGHAHGGTGVTGVGLEGGINLYGY